jgi:membrane protein YqaA with SNARE-associated domain
LSHWLAQVTDFLVKLGPWGILAVSAIDSAGIPLSVGLDLMVILLSVKSPEAALLNVALAVLGSTTGTMFLYYAARKGGQKFVDREAPESRTGRFRRWFHQYGLLTVFVPALIPFPMPMKPFIVLSGAFGIRPPALAATVVLARVLRYGSEAWLGVQMGAASKQFVDMHRWQLGGLAVALFLTLYLVVRLRLAGRSRDGGYNVL